MLKRVCLVVLVLAACGRDKGGEPDVAPPPPEPITAPGPPLEVRLDSARALLRQGEIKKAQGLLERLVLEAPTDAPVWTALAAARLAAQEPAGAVEAAKRATTLDPKDAQAFVTGGAALRAQGDLDGAIKSLERALVIDPTLASAYWNLAGIHGQRHDDAREALVLDALVKAHPDDVAARFARAQNALRQKDAPLAKQTLLDLVERAPTHEPAQRTLAALAWDARDYRQALERAKIALRLDESDNAAQKLLESSYYVLAAAELLCKVGPRPWNQPEAPGLLMAFAKQSGLENALVFGEIDAEFGDLPDVRARVQAHKDLTCPGTIEPAPGGPR